MHAVEWTPVDNVIRFRLRRNDRIVGWMREEVTGQRFYSRDGLWWSGRKIQWTHRDRCCGWRDIDDRWLHEGDLIRLSVRPWWPFRAQWLILCDEKSGWSAVRVMGMATKKLLTPEEVSRSKWRWCGFGWMAPQR